MILNGRNVIVMPLSLDHLADLSKHGKEPSLWARWLRKPLTDTQNMKSEIELALAQEKNGKRIPFSIYHRELKECVGSTSLLSPDIEHQSVEIGATWLAAPFHQTGINRECKDLLLQYVFCDLKMNRVALQTDELNLRSRRAIEKLGAKLDGVLREDKVTWDGRRRSSAVYSILRNEWLGASRSPQSAATDTKVQ